MKKLILICCCLLSLPLFSKDFNFKGKIESVLSTQYKMRPNNKNMEEFLPDKEYPLIKAFFILDENGKITQKTISYDDIDAIYLEDLFNYFLSIADNPLEILSSSLDSSTRFVYDNNMETRQLFSPGDFKQPDTITDIYKDGKVVERTVLDSYGRFREKIKFTYTTLSKPVTNVLTAKFYNDPSLVSKIYTFIYDKDNKLIEFSKDKYDTFKCIYDKKGNLVEIYTYSNNDKQQTKKWQITMAYNDKGFMISKYVKLGKERKYKYEYEFDKNENPIIIKTFVEQEYFGNLTYIPHSIQINTIKY